MGCVSSDVSSFFSRCGTTTCTHVMANNNNNGQFLCPLFCSAHCSAQHIVLLTTKGRDTQLTQNHHRHSVKLLGLLEFKKGRVFYCFPQLLGTISLSKIWNLWKMSTYWSKNTTISQTCKRTIASSLSIHECTGKSRFVMNWHQARTSTGTSSSLDLLQ
jgi:hypothetical protein